MVRSCSLVLVLSLLGCGSEATPSSQPAAPAATPVAPEPVKPSPPAEAPKAEPAPVVAAPDNGPLGIPACDEYLTAYRGCITGLVAIAQESHTKVVDGQRAAWGKAKADPKLAPTLPEACTAARAAAKVALPECKGW